MTAKILIVDGEIVFHRIIIQHFRKDIVTKKYNFVSALNSKEALNKIQSGHQIDLMLLSIKLPDNDGFTLLKQLNEQNIRIKTVFLSANGDKENYKKAMQSGAYDFLEKPISAVELAETIDKALRIDKRTLKAPPSSSQVTGAKILASNVSDKKPHTNGLLRMVKELPPPQRAKFICQLIETIDNFEDLEDIGYKVEAQVQIAADSEAEKEEFLVENQKREIRGETPLIMLENGWVEMRYMTRKLVTGEKRRYGPYYYMRWREDGKLKSKCFGKEDPSALLKDSNIRVYEMNADTTDKSSLEEEMVQEKRVEPKKFRLDLSKNIGDFPRSTK